MKSKNVTQFASHAHVDKKHKWDLSFLLEGKTPEQVMQSIKLGLEELIKLNSNKYENSNSYLSYLVLEDKLSPQINKFRNYISNSLSINPVDQSGLKLKNDFEFILYNINQQMGPDESLFLKHSEKIKEWVKDEKFKNYRYLISYKIQEKDHTLSENDEKFRQLESRADISASEIFRILTNVEIDYGYAETSKGYKIHITKANYSQLTRHKDAKVRKTAQISYRSAFLKHKGSLSSLIFQHKKSEQTWSKILKFDSAVEYLIFPDRISKDFLLTLFDVVQSNVHHFKKYDTYYKKFYQAKFKEKPTKWDMARELSDKEVFFSIDEGKKDVINALKPFGEEYQSVVSKAFNENWIDFMPIKNKYSGAYSIGSTYGVDKKLILMNWESTSRSVETLIHEIGHSLHSYFSDKKQHIRNASYSIFVAEIASIFNELMLFDYWIKNSKNDFFRFQVLSQMIKGFNGTVMRQTQWANYEFNFYELLDQGTSLNTYESISKLYYENSQKYSFKQKTKFVLDEQFASIYVPHFYYGFYVYKYAIGQLVANVFFQKYKNEGPKVLENYIQKFLSVGGSKDPLIILKDAGIDLLDKQTYELGFKSLENTIDEWVKLGKKIFKVN